jgi:hypothetical protein
MADCSRAKHCRIIPVARYAPDAVVSHSLLPSCRTIQTGVSNPRVVGPIPHQVSELEDSGLTPMLQLHGVSRHVYWYSSRGLIGGAE